MGTGALNKTWFRALIPASLIALCPFLPAQPVDERIPDYDCLDCHGQRTLVKTNADEQVVSMFTDAGQLRASAHGTNWCVDCHGDLRPTHPHDRIPARRVECGLCHKEFAGTYNQSSHGRARKKGKTDAAWCTACHGAHDLLATRHPESKLHGATMYDTCGTCHQEEAAALKQSAHAKAWEKNQPGAPTCASCHRAHGIHSLKGLSPLTISLVTCGQCHGREPLNAAFKLPAVRVETYMDHYHGLAAQWGQTNMPHCASCHGNHRVLSADHPDSLIHPGHLAQTCGKCHEGAGTQFTLGKIHTEPAATDLGSRAKRWASRIYQVLIPMVIGLLLGHFGLSLITRLRFKGAVTVSPPARLSPALMVQHLLLLASVALLAWSGFALRFPDSIPAWTLGADEEIRRWLHRGSAIVLVAVALAHTLYLRVSADGNRFQQAMSLSRLDWNSIKEAGRHLIRLSPPPAQPGFGYVEKIEYWAIHWGILIMVATGGLQWFYLEATQFMPRWMLDVGMTIHYYEAILAALAISVWQGYHFFIRPSKPRLPASVSTSYSKPTQ